MSSKVAEMPKKENPAPENNGVADELAANEQAFQERVAQLISNDPTASRLQGRLEILRSLGATA